MSAREVLRRVLLWGIVSIFLANSVILAVFGEWTSLIGFSAFPAVGAIILTSRPGNGVGRFLLGVGIVSIPIMWGLDPEAMGHVPAWTESALNAAAGPFFTSLILIGVFFPTGRPETPLGRVALWTVAVTAAGIFFSSVTDPGATLSSGRPNPLAVSEPEILGTLAGYWPLSIAAATVAIVVDLVLRWREASPIARLQYRWFVFALVGVLTMTSIAGILNGVAAGSVAAALIDHGATASLNLIPISIGIAVTRHGLYEINRIISRTVGYTTVTALAVGVYALVVTSITWLAPQLPSVGVAVATLTAAGVFLPALRWAQRSIDRRFDRERYDAERVVDAFGERLRTQINPTATTGDLLRAVERTLQPTTAGLWQREA